VSLLRSLRPVQADSKVSTKEAMSPSPLDRVSTTLHHFVRLFPFFARLSSNKTYQNSNQNRSSQVSNTSHHLFSFSQAAFGRCNTQIDYRRWVVYMIYGKCRDVTSANMFLTL
jgi:hypothetical protein